MLESMVFHHIGIATDSINKTSKYYLNAGYHMTNIISDTIQKVNIVFLSKSNMPLIELLEPISEDSPVTKIIKKNGVTPYHVCYEVEDINQSVAALRKMRFMPLFKSVEAIALDNRKICFLFNKEIGLIELLEK